MEWQTILFSVFGIVLTTLATWAVERLIVFINARVSGSKYAKYIKISLEIIVRAVKSTYQTYVKDLKNKNIFTRDAQIEALKKAKDNALSQMSADIKKYLASHFGDVDNWIEDMIESVIYDLKYIQNKHKDK